MFVRPAALLLVVFTALGLAIKYEPDQISWNLNQNQTATNPSQYWGQWENHSESAPRLYCSTTDRTQHTTLLPKIGVSLSIP